MLIARNKNNKIVNIIESVKDEEYKCPICNEVLTRNYGLERQFFSHPKDKGNECELKIKQFLNNNSEFTNEDLIILKSEYYDKKFDNLEIDFSDYKSEEGYYLTQEQKDIIFSKEDRIKVSALAGSAKTSTMYYYCKEHPFKRILYIVYNKSMADEAKKTFGNLTNVTIKTTHGLAYGYVGKYYKDKLTFNYNAIDVIRDLNLDYERDQEIAVKVYELLKEYMLSDVNDIFDMKLFEDDKKNKDIIYLLAKKLWELKKEYKNNVKIEHDFYLKLFQLQKKDLSNLYNCIILDEAQDSNLLTMSIILNSNTKGIVMVGDQYQSLYKWRKAINVLDLLENAKEYKLTTSFRVNMNIANLANLVIEDVTNDKINMKGFNSKQKIVDKLDTNKPYACLSRSNSILFQEVINAMNERKTRLFFEGGFGSYKFNNIKDAYYFSLGHDVKNPILNKFKNWNEMYEFAEKNEDVELLSLIRMVENYGSEIPKLVDNIKNIVTTDKSKAQVIFTTIHRSKGMTYKRVKIMNDTFDIHNFYNKKFIEVDKTLEENEFFEEAFILYVALTRASEEIELNDVTKNYLLLRYKFNNK